MKKIKVYVLLFTIIYSLQLLFSILFFIFLQNDTTIFSFLNKINENTIIVLGNSHTECAVNDNIFPNRFKNLSTSGEPLFYTSLKAKRIFKSVNVDTVIIEFGNNAFNSIHYVTGDDHFIKNFQQYLSLMTPTELLFLIENNPIKFFKGFLSTNIISIFRSQKLGGAYLELRRVNDFNRQTVFEKKTISHRADWVNFKSLLDLIKSNRRITFIIIRSPVHYSDNSGFDSEYKYGCNLLKSMPNVSFFDFKSLNMPDSFYADDEHLNHFGARYFTKLLYDKLKK